MEKINGCVRGCVGDCEGVRYFDSVADIRQYVGESNLNEGASEIFTAWVLAKMDKIPYREFNSHHLPEIEMYEIFEAYDRKNGSKI